MEESENGDLELMISTFHKTLEKEWYFVVNNNWTTDEILKSRVKAFEIHVLITSKVVTQAATIIKQSVNLGLQSNLKVKKVGEWAHKFFNTFDSYFNAYIETQDYLEMLSGGKDVAGEIEFQTTASKNHFSLQSKIKDIASVDTKKKIVINTWNDVPIPLAMRRATEREFPEILEYLKERQKEEVKPKKH